MDIEIYTKKFCPFCQKAKALLSRKGLSFKEIFIENDIVHAEMIDRCGQHTVPQIFFNTEHIGGWDDLCKLDVQNELDKYLKMK
ncbi:glutaredoxin 3 [Blochmannia endosymbiont of Camponotus (Colobopsis) obliquus]|uniref:glutaredoxin 3 n=1 Tax=Blochmannia endosymbiont of Camponotus (Colobopsis) obliquus TaxID=1505597 RepID=UPI00061A80D2|nr:glutaredoxin 3 [Blochmannia endosymbiont of Camponotus (Colobopsis) obliquus]